MSYTRERAKGAEPPKDMTFTTLDLSLFKNGGDADREIFGSRLLSGLSKQGFVKLVGHGVSDCRVDKLFEWVGP